MPRHKKRKNKSSLSANPSVLPLQAKPITDLKFENNDSFQGKVLLAKRIKNDHKTLSHSTYFYKPRLNPPLAQLEAYSTSVCRLLASEEYAPSSTSYYDTITGQIRGIASKELRDFRNLHDDPLQAKDAEIGCINEVYYQNILMAKIDKILSLHQSASSPSLMSRISGLLWQQSPGVQFGNQLMI